MNNYQNKYFPSLHACAIVAPAIKGTALSIRKFKNFKSLIDEFGSESIANPLVLLAKVLFLNNLSEVYCIAPSINC